MAALCVAPGGRERFTLAVKCPFACPICGQLLEWHGGCDACHGSRTPWDRDTWTFPGDRYERTEGGHWERIDESHAACTPAQSKAAAELVKRVLAGRAHRREGPRATAVPPGRGARGWHAGEF